MLTTFRTPLVFAFCICLGVTPLLMGCQPAASPSTTGTTQRENTATQSTAATENLKPTEAPSPQTAKTMPQGQAYLEDFPVILQEPLQPSGCEVTSLTMVLNYWGMACTNVELADNYLPYGSYGDDMFNLMIGSVYDDYALGCYAGAIVQCAQDYAEANDIALAVEDISGSSLEDYCRQLDQGHPVIVWATENMMPTYPDIMWEVNGRQTGYMKGEHCLVMIGYNLDEDTVVMADPIRGEVTYELSTFYERNQEMFAQAVLVLPAAR